MIHNIKDLREYLGSGGKVKQTYHINPNARTLGTIRTVAILRKNEWIFSDGAYMSPPPTNIEYNETGFAVKDKNGIVIIRYEYISEEK